MRKSLLKYLLLLLFSLVMSCNDDFVEVREFPGVTTESVSDITADGATLHASVTLRKNPQIEMHGFVWSTHGIVPKVGGSNGELKFSGPPQNNQFTARITASLEKGEEYTVRAFVIAQGITVYGREEKFVSLGSQAPLVRDYNPKSGTWGDTISFSGKNFSTVLNGNEVVFGAAKAIVIFATDTLIKVKVPDVFNGLQADVKLSVSKNAANKLEKFTYLQLQVNLVSPLTVTFGDTLTILGSNIHRAYTSVLIDDLTTHVVALTQGEIKVMVPAALNKNVSQIKIISAGQEIIFSRPLVLKPQKIHRIEPDTITRYKEEITIYGENFSPVPGNNRLLYQGYYLAQVVESSNTHIKVILPAQIITTHHVSEFKDFVLDLNIAGSVVKESLFLKWNSTWTLKNNFPGEARAGAIAFSLMNTGYYGIGTNKEYTDLDARKDFWKYDDKNDTWQRLADFPGRGTQHAASFSLHDKGYVLGGSYQRETPDGVTFDQSSTFMRFDPVTGTWESIAPYPGRGQVGLTGIAMDNTALVGAGYDFTSAGYYDYSTYRDFWIYNPSDNSWKATTSLDHTTALSPGFFAANKAYVYSDDGLYRLGTGKWERFLPTQHYSQYAIAFVIGSTGYYGLGSIGIAGSSSLWAYDTQTGASFFYPSPTHIYASSVFVVNQKAYIIGGINRYDPTNVVWEFDPSKPDK
jgi:hypothetical protein